MLEKIASIYVFLVCKIFGPKIWSCEFFLTNFKFGHDASKRGPRFIDLCDICCTLLTVCHMVTVFKDPIPNGQEALANNTQLTFSLAKCDC